MSRYDDTFVDRFLKPWNRHDVDGALALMTDDCVWEAECRYERYPHSSSRLVKLNHINVIPFLAPAAF
jgi:ketosteroid isomerase-like protein